VQSVLRLLLIWALKESFVIANRKVRFISFALFLCTVPTILIGQRPESPGVGLGPVPRVYVFFQRASSHVHNGRADSFQAVADIVKEELKAGNVAMAPDQSGGSTYSEGEMPLALVQEIAQKAGAAYLLYVVVERPHTRWLKVTLHLYETNGHELWSQEASKTAYLSSTGNRETIERVGVLIKERVGGPGLPVLPRSAESAQVPPLMR
jgi:hypothetical protein